MHVDIFASLKNQICPHFSLSCIFVLENSVVNLSERVDTFCKPEESHSSAARAATGNLCQKAQIAKSWKYFSANLTYRAASALGRASQPGKKTNHRCRKLFCTKICESSEDLHCSTMFQPTCFFNLWLRVVCYLRSS